MGHARDHLGSTDKGRGRAAVADVYTGRLPRRSCVGEVDERAPAGRERLEPAQVDVSAGPVGQMARRCCSGIKPEGADRLQLAQHGRQMLLEKRPAPGLQVVHQAELPDAPPCPVLPRRLRIIGGGFVPVEHHDLQPLLGQQDGRRQPGRSPTQHDHVCHRTHGNLQSILRADRPPG